jgi:hypothetical protein
MEGKVNRILLALAFALSLLSCVSCETKSSASSSARTLFGVALRTATHICFSIQNSSLRPKSLVTLVSPSNPQSIAQAEVIKSTANTCPGVHNVMPGRSNYDLRLLSGKVEENLPLIAVVGGSSQFTSTASPVKANLQAYSQPVFFRSCTSADGVHLTAWRGTPLKGTRIWHQYYYLGQDLEATCTGKDTAQ